MLAQMKLVLQGTHGESRQSKLVACPPFTSSN